LPAASSVYQKSVMKTYFILILALISIPDIIYSQRFKEPINYRFKNGEDGYVSFFSKTITFPPSSIENGTIANSIIRISLNPDGKIEEMTVINPIDSIIDNEVLKAIDLSKNIWLKCDTTSHNQVFYLQIAFSLPGILPNLCSPENKEIKRLFPEPIMISLPEPMIDSFSKKDETESAARKSEEIAEKANNYLASEQLAEALPLISELIKRDPFNRDLYKVRIMINIKLNRPELVEEDDNKIINFAEGYSIDDLNKVRY
jgi:hypothetical protein